MHTLMEELTATRAPQSPQHPASTEPESFDRAYWLAHCEGYGVESANGRVGFVNDVAAQDGRGTITVRAGLFGRRLLVYSVEDVALVVPRAQKLYLYAAAQPLESFSG